MRVQAQVGLNRVIDWFGGSYDMGVNLRGFSSDSGVVNISVDLILDLFPRRPGTTPPSPN